MNTKISTNYYISHWFAIQNLFIGDTTEIPKIYCFHDVLYLSFISFPFIPFHLTLCLNNNTSLVKLDDIWLSNHKYNKKAVLSQRWPRNAPYSLNGCSEKFWESLAMPTANFCNILMDFCSDRSHDCVQNLKSEDVGLIVRAMISKIYNLCGPDPPVTHGRTNAHMHGRHAIARPRFAV